MALTRKLLKGMGLTEEQVDTIIEAHTETVDGLKADAAKYKADAERLTSVQRELDELKEAGDVGYREKYEAEHTAYEKLRADIAAEKATAAREKAARAYFESRGITGDNLTIAMMGSGRAIAELELEGESIRDTAALDALVGGAFAKLVTTTTVTGADTPHPPENNPSPAEPKSLAEALRAKYETKG